MNFFTEVSIIHAYTFVVFLSGTTLFLSALIRGLTSQNEEDLRLFARIIARDQTALGQLYDRYASLVYTLVLRIVKAPTVAEDLLQEIFLQIWNKATTFSATKGSVYTWIMTIARRRAIDFLRSKESATTRSTVDDEPTLALPDEAHSANPLESAISSEYEACMKEALNSLNAEVKAIIELSYYDGYTQAQIAERLGLPLGTVKTWMRQGLMKLRAYIKERLEL